ncbi:MAG: hypothetical protein CO136_01980 [Candidatus Levybacteria bacterium CG_4_9_14_3_um_filter_36_7]|nr:MAG: hypothetical protein AUK12_01475 [Candidatus Levybacteria bacterium CG2_30_37_29]PIR79428.1 MAG: hypothetical protein COU26_01270 [Candidatus Levybacteria bacterium CG10_big_fil_rev_8_21_14_0_10_36_30]PJA90509.1 MAG: hypothetical protein CO136_01980 [Candidatus Levybacteria bacterium CG_4_9_14_3_um_filter_36_7]
MIKKLDGVLLSSENTTKLVKFYREIVGLKQGMEFEMEDGKKVYSFDDVQLFINPHSEVSGKNKNPERFMLNFEVDDIEKEVEKVKKAGAKQTQDIYHIEGYGLVSTFEDVDGNFFQLVQVKQN